jgi:two-component system sensor histidine kinase YesM
MQSAGARRPATIRRRLLLTFGAIIALLSVFSALIFSAIQQTQRFLTLVQGHLFGIVALSSGVDRLYAAADNFLHSGRKDYLVEYDRQLAACASGAAALAAELSGDLHYRMNDIGNMVRSFDELKAVAVTRYGEGLELIYVNRYVAELGRLRNYIRSECSGVLYDYMVGVDSEAAKMRSGLARSAGLSWLVLSLVTAACVALALRIIQDISRPIHELAQSLQSFAEGELDLPPIERRRKDEISTLVESFNLMTQRIRGLVEEIRRKSELESELKRGEIKALELENALKQSELETLQSRINPHFLFNTLNTIATLADIEDAHKTRGAVTSLAALLRAQMDSARGWVGVGEELESAEHYLRIQEMRFGARLGHELDLSPEAARLRLPGMVVQPFVENAVLHGLEPLERGGRVRIGARVEGSDLVVEIEDDGIGFDPALPSANGGVGEEGAARRHEGIANVSRRLELLCGRQAVFVESAPGTGTRVTIRIPADQLERD